MSIRCSAIAQYASIAQAFSIGTGDLYFGCWAYEVVANDGQFLNLLDTAWDGAYSDFAWIRSLNTGATLRGHTVNGFIGGYGSAAQSTWYYCVLTRVSGTLQFRVFDDSSSTTPLYDNTASDSTDYDTLDNLILMSPINGEWFNGEICSVKLVTDSFSASDAECRTESQNLDIVKSGGTLRYAWDLEDIDADVQGLNERGGSGPNFTNTGLVAGSSRPSQLEAQGGGGSISVDDGDGPVGMTVQGSARQVRLF